MINALSCPGSRKTAEARIKINVSFIDGIKLPDGSRWGGLDGLCKVLHTFKSRGKGGIESAFNLLQNLVEHSSPSIGAKARRI
jgi:hypothetical protein